jgi:hypothetical protein
MATVLSGGPGVYIHERRARTSRALPTGVPVFIGLLEQAAPLPADTPQDADFYGPVALHHKTEFLGGASFYLADAINGFFDNGGDYCYVVAIMVDSTKADAQGPDRVTDPDAAANRLINALDLTVALDDVDLVAIPDAQALMKDQDATLVLQVQRAMITHCTTGAPRASVSAGTPSAGTRIAVLDALNNRTAQALLSDQVQQLGVSAVGPVNAAIYHPWIHTIGSGSRPIPPSGQVAGIIARTDAAVGFFGAPANAELRDATDLEAVLDPDSLALLNASGVNCLRAFPARGIRVMGARTLSRDPDWTYLNVRRLVLTLLRWIDANMTWAVFEPNVPALWARIERELGTYLTALWRAGALQGDVVTDAFFVRCNADLNPANSREAGNVVTEIGLAPAAPAEFILVTVQHNSSTTELT